MRIIYVSTFLRRGIRINKSKWKLINLSLQLRISLLKIYIAKNNIHDFIHV